MPKLTGKAKCEWLLGVERTKKENRTGDCQNCERYKLLGVHRFCDSSGIGRVTILDCAIFSIKSNLDNQVRCQNCNTLLKPKTVRCSECLHTEELKNFKKWIPGKKIEL